MWAVECGMSRGSSAPEGVRQPNDEYGTRLDVTGTLQRIVGYLTLSAPEGGNRMMSMARGCVSQSLYNTLLFTIIDGTMGGNNHMRW